VSARARSAWIALALLVSACAKRPDVPAAINDALGSRRILSYREDSLDSTSTLVLEYETKENLLDDWERIVGEVARISEPLQAEADRKRLPGVRIMIRSVRDYTTFDFRRSENGWKEVWRDIISVHEMPGGGKIGLRSLEEHRDARDPWMSIAYITELDLKEQLAVRDEAAMVLSMYSERATSFGARSVLVSPSDRARAGTSIGLTFERDDPSGAWKPAF
jgi:hypothetical protein